MIFFNAIASNIYFLFYRLPNKADNLPEITLAPLSEQIMFPSLNDDQLLRLSRSLVKFTALIYRNDFIICAMSDEHRTIDPGDLGFRVESIPGQQMKPARKPGKGFYPHITG